MFHQPPGVGWLEVICGSMFSGKSEELIRRLRRAQIARQHVQSFKPEIDDRYGTTHIVSHSAAAIEAEVAPSSGALLERVRPETQVVGIDEAQFFDAGIVQVAHALADRGVRVIVAGLDQDYQGRPFDPIPALLATAEHITKTMAVCTRCGAPANRSQRLVENADRVVVGGAGAYEARCRRCWSPRPAAAS